jgi:hypothetical protein
MKMMTVLSTSGGMGSGFALKEAIAQEGRENVVAVFADVKGTGASHFWSDLPIIEQLLHERYGGESRDLYRFLWHLSNALDFPIHRIEDGRSIWAAFAQARAFRLNVNKRFFCKASEWLKRETIAQWLEANYQPGTYRMALGMGFWEGHRIANAQAYWRNRLGWDIEVYSPIADKGIDQCVISDWLNEVGIEPSSAYTRGLPHDNCGGICVQAGQNQFAEVYQHEPERYLYAAWQEMRLRQIVGIDATILKDERGGTAKPMSLYEFEPRILAGDWNKRDLGGACSCFTTPAMTAFLAQIEVKGAS